MQRITFNRPQRALLQQVIENWRGAARMAQQDMQLLTAGDAKLMNRRAAHLLACADELQQVIDSGDLPLHFGYQIRLATAKDLREPEEKA